MQNICWCKLGCSVYHHDSTYGTRTAFELAIIRSSDTGHTYDRIADAMQYIEMRSKYGERAKKISDLCAFCSKSRVDIYTHRIYELKMIRNFWKIPRIGIFAIAGLGLSLNIS